MDIDRDLAINFIKKRSLGVLATIGEETPMSSAIYYVTTSSGNIRFITKDGTNKYRNIKNNNNVSFTIVDSYQPIAVNLVGEAIIIEGTNEIESTLRQISKISSGGASSLPVVKLKKGDFVVIEIVPKRLQYTDYTSPFEHGSEYIFEF